MSLTLELPADVLADLDAEAASNGTSPESIVTNVLRNHFATARNPVPDRAETLDERKVRFAEDEAAYQEWWDAHTPEDQQALNAKWERSSLSADAGRHSLAEVVFARIRAKHAPSQQEAAHK